MTNEEIIRAEFEALGEAGVRAKLDANEYRFRRREMAPGWLERKSQERREASNSEQMDLNRRAAKAAEDAATAAREANTHASAANKIASAALAAALIAIAVSIYGVLHGAAH